MVKAMVRHSTSSSGKAINEIQMARSKLQNIRQSPMEGRPVCKHSGLKKNKMR
jgi:hypothetical protein